MADLVLGVAKSLVEGTLSRAQSAIEEESLLRKSTRRDLVFITGEFQMMQSYLTTTSRENVKNNVVSTWVTQLRDLAYDVEDGIEFVVHLDPKSGWWLRVIPSFIAPARPLDEAADIIEQLKARVQDVRQRSSHYNLISSDSSGPKPPVEEETQKKLLPASQERRDRDMEALTNLITNKTMDLQVISLWCVPAAGGDLEVIRNAYNNPKGWGNFSRRAWVKVAQSVNIHDIVGILLQTLQVAEDDLQKVLETGKYLVVLEDVSSKDVGLDTIRKYFPDNGNGSRIIVITQQFQIATLCTGRPFIQRFSADFSLGIFSKEPPLIGRTSEIENLLEYLAKARMNALQVISVWGMAGTGKSALVRNLYHEKARHKKEFQKHGWVDVSHPFDLRAICHSLFLQFKLHSPEKDEDIVKECHSILKYQRCLVVIDNLQSRQDWDAIEDTLLFRPSESIIIIITNDESIALHCANREEFVFNVKALEAGAAFDLFAREVARDKYLARCDVKKDQVLQPLISMCGGLPKIVVAIFAYLADVYRWATKGKELADKFIINLETRPEFTCLRDLFPWIHYYFRSCPDYLKPCMFYLSIFPKSQIIRRRRLVMRWIAEGYSKDKASDAAEDNGEEIFARIIELSMIQPPEEETIVTSMRMVRCQVNAFFHEYIITRPKEENVTFALEVFSLKGRCRQTTGRTGRHLVIEESWKRDRIVFDTIDFSRLRSLTVFGKWESFFISESMKVLRVLDLENASGVKNKDLKIMLKLLPRLKFLSLRGCSEISYLPACVSDLRQLQILDVRYTSIVAMPASITKLKRLQYLRAGNDTNPLRNDSAQGTVAFKLSKIQRCLQLVGVNVESGVGKITTLHTLGVVNVGGAGGKDILNELKNLTQLRKIGVSGVCRKNRKEFYSAISDHSHLQSLSVWFKENNEVSLCEGTSEPEVEPPNELQSLKLYGPVKKLPTWIKQLNSIRKLKLEMDILSADDIKVLGELKELCILGLIVKPNQGGFLEFRVETNGLEDRSYKKIKVLEIYSRSHLHLTIGRKAMENLELLKVRSCCSGSNLQFAGLKDLSELKEICIICSQDQALKNHLGGQFPGCPIIPVFKPEGVNAPAEASNGGHNNFIASTLASGNNNIRVTTGGNEHAHGSTGRNGQTQTTTIGGNGLTQTERENEQCSTFSYISTTPFKFSGK